MASEPWFVSAFRAEYLAVYPHRDLDSARREARHLVAGGLRGRVLDLGCGFGRHTLALRELGLDVCGLDLSHELLAHARTLPGARALEGRLVRADSRALPLAAGALDAVVCLFSSFGYFDDAGNARMLAETARVLAPGGRLVLDLINPERVRGDLVPRSRRSGEGFVLEESRALAEGGRRVEKEVRLRLGDRPERAWRESVRMYEVAEMRGLLDRAGFDLERVEGDFDGSEHGASSPRQIVHSVRR